MIHIKMTYITSSITSSITSLLFIFRNPNDPFAEIIPETPELDSSINGNINKDDDDLFKGASKPVSNEPFKFEKANSSLSSSTNSSISSPISSIPDYNNFSTSTPATTSSLSSSSKPMGKLSKFGAVKVVKSVNFDEIEAKARQEREEADRRGLGMSQMKPASTSTIVQTSPKELEPVSSPIQSTSGSKNSKELKETKESTTQTAISKEQQEMMDRLGMGMRKMNIKQSVSSSSNATAATAKIKQQSAISSEQFNRNSSSVEDSFVNDRLREIDTSKGISSDAFFGRNTNNNDNNSNTNDYNDNDDDDYYYKSPSNHSNTSATYSNLTNSAKDLASRIAEKASNIDIKGMKKSISSAGTRLSSYLQDLQNKN